MPTKSTSLTAFAKRNGAWLGLLLLLLILSFSTQGDFLSPRNLTNLIRQASINGILAGGMTFVILSGGIDLSIGSLVALCGILVGVTQVHWLWSGIEIYGALGSVALALFAGLSMGTITGSLIAFLGIPPFVITLGIMVIARGLSLILSGGESLSPMGEGLQAIATTSLDGIAASLLTLLFVGLFCALLYRAFRRFDKNWTSAAVLDFLPPGLVLVLFLQAFFRFHGIPVMVVIFAAVMFCLGIVLHRTTLGRSVYALGSNSKAAFWAGVPIRRVTVAVYSIMGLLSGLAAILLTSRLNGSEPNAGQLMELDAIAAVVIGGASLKGGQGSIMGAVVGALMMATLNNGMDLLGIPSFYQMVCKGMIIILAVSLDSTQRERA
jgi:D-xylose transport system permease protein